MRLKTTEDVIDAMGGNKEFAAAIGATPQAVNNWRRGKTFPANQYVIITEVLLAAKIIVPNSLFAMKRRKKRK